MDIVDVLCICCIIAIVTVCPTECRQNCLTCQFQSTVEGYEDSQGKECITAPLNWTGSEVRMKCPSLCTITARFDEKTLIPTFFHRGCQDITRKDGCSKTGLWFDCFYSCGGDGKNYCNNQTSLKVIQEKIDEKNKKNKEEENDDMAASLYCLVGLIGICAVGYFVKKKYCTRPEDEEEDVGVS